MEYKVHLESLHDGLFRLLDRIKWTDMVFASILIVGLSSLAGEYMSYKSRVEFLHAQLPEFNKLSSPIHNAYEQVSPGKYYLDSAVAIPTAKGTLSTDVSLSLRLAVNGTYLTEGTIDEIYFHHTGIWTEGNDEIVLRPLVGTGLHLPVFDRLYLKEVSDEAFMVESKYHNDLVFSKSEVIEILPKVNAFNILSRLSFQLMVALIFSLKVVLFLVARRQLK